MERNPYLHQEYGMPIEIPVVHEGSGSSSAAAALAQQSSEAKKPRIPEDETVCPDKTLGKETRIKKQPSPKSHLKKPSSSKPYGTRHVPVNDMESSEDVYDEEFPFFYPKASSEMYEDELPFGNGFPFLTSSRCSPFSNLQSKNATSPKKSAAKSAPEVVHKPAEKRTLKKTAATTEPPTAAEQPRHEKVRNVPIVMEDAQHSSPRQQPKLPAKKSLTAMEQLENIQKEMEVIENRVDNFSGEKTDKEYVVLDETMTSLLLKLDTIESNGVEEIRNKRRQLVIHTQECVQRLERKVGIVSPVEETNSDEAKTMAVEDAETKSKEETDPELTDAVMDSQVGSAEEQIQALDVDVEKASSTEVLINHDSDQSLRLEGDVQTQVDGIVSSTQEMVVDNTEIESNCTLETEANPENENQTFDTIKITDLKEEEMTTDTKQLEKNIELNLEAAVSNHTENCDVANDTHLSDEQYSVTR